MRRTIITLGLLIPVAACSSDNGWFGSDSNSRQSSATYGTSSTPSTASNSSTSMPVVPPQAGQAGQSSQQARDNIARQPGGPQTLSGTTGMSSTGMMQLSAAEQSFVMDAAQGGMAEVELGKLAEQRGSSAQVRDFGRMMVQQHSQANSELTAWAQRMGISPPTSLSPAAQAAQMRLQSAQGQDFDRQYLEQQAAAHLEQRAAFQFAANNAKNQELRSFAQKTLPVIERHIDQLRTISPMATRTGS
jgi:putative membrane protein